MIKHGLLTKVSRQTVGRLDRLSRGSKAHAVVVGAPAILITLLVAGVLWMTAVPGRSHTGPPPPLAPDQVQLAARLQEHVRAVASRPHNVSHPHELEQAALYLRAPW